MYLFEFDFSIFKIVFVFKYIAALTLWEYYTFPVKILPKLFQYNKLGSQKLRPRPDKFKEIETQLTDPFSTLILIHEP